MQNSGHLSADRWSHALRSDQQKKLRPHNYGIDVDKLRKNLIGLYDKNQRSQNILAKTNNVWDPNLGLKMSRNINLCIINIFILIYTPKDIIML
jgi:hypothetical protein